MKRGKFVVIEGIDGTGKETQAKLLVEKLKKKGFRVKMMDFPQYEKTFFGRLVGRFLKGEFGNLKEVNPYLAALTFAGDRWQAKEDIENFLNKGAYVVSNRYALSNMHQVSKLPVRRRQKILDFLEELEYGVYKIPREDLDIVLDLPAKIGRKLVMKKRSRSYLGSKKKKDIQEANVAYQEETRKVYNLLVKKFPYIKKVSCIRGGDLMRVEEVHEKVWNVVSDSLGIK